PDHPVPVGEGRRAKHGIDCRPGPVLARTVGERELPVMNEKVMVWWRYNDPSRQDAFSVSRMAGDKAILADDLGQYALVRPDMQRAEYCGGNVAGQIPKQVLQRLHASAGSANDHHCETAAGWNLLVHADSTLTRNRAFPSLSRGDTRIVRR